MFCTPLSTVALIVFHIVITESARAILNTVRILLLFLLPGWYCLRRGSLLVISYWQITTNIKCRYAYTHLWNIVQTYVSGDDRTLIFGRTDWSCVLTGSNLLYSNVIRYIFCLFNILFIISTHKVTYLNNYLQATR